MRETKLELHRLESIVKSMKAFQNNESNELVKARMISTYAEILQEISESLSETADRVFKEFME